MLKKCTNEIKNTAHSKYRCEYHIVFAPKYRRKEIYGQPKKDIGEILRKLCAQSRRSLGRRSKGTTRRQSRGLHVV